MYKGCPIKNETDFFYRNNLISIIKVSVVFFKVFPLGLNALIPLLLPIVNNVGESIFGHVLQDRLLNVDNGNCRVETMSSLSCQFRVGNRKKSQARCNVRT